jgi:hypothetical protein
MILDLERGTYRDLGETNHMYAFIVVDYLGRAYHPLLGGDIARYDPKTDRLERLKQTIDGASPTPESHLADPTSHPINWEISPNKRTLYAVPMSGNQIYDYDLTARGDTLAGRSVAMLVPGAVSTDCRAMCVAPNGIVWAGVDVELAGKKKFLHLVSYKPGDSAAVNHGPLAVGNPDFTNFTNRRREPLPWHHGFYRFGDGNLLPRYTVMGICAARSGTVYLTTLAPFTLHEVRPRQVPQPPELPRKPIAGIATEYRYNSHADLILGRLVQTETLDGRGRVPTLRLASLYTDQVPKNDTSRRIAADLALPIYKTIPETLTLGGDRIAVEGAMIVAEHGDYPDSPTGAQAYPKRRMFEQLFATVDKHHHRGLPVFCDKHLADTWTDARWIYDEARRRGMPLMAGSSVPSAWREPPIDLPRDTRLKQIVAVSYHRIDIYGFHALEALQALAERRAGGETGVAAVQYFEGDEVWQGADRGVYNRRVLDAALAAMRERPLPQGKKVEELAKKPSLCVIEYRDGTRGCLFTLDGPVAEWTVAWQDEQDQIASVAFRPQEDRPYSHFAILVNAIEQFMTTGRAPWPVERTLLTSGLIDEFLISKSEGGKRRETRHLDVTYRSDWNWTMPIAPAPARPAGEQ